MFDSTTGNLLERLLSVSLVVFVGLVAFGGGWFLLVVAGIESTIYESVLRTLTAPVELAVRRFGLRDAGDAVGMVVFLGYYGLVAFLLAVVAVTVHAGIERFR